MKNNTSHDFFSKSVTSLAVGLISISEINFTLEQAMKAQKGSRGFVLFNLGARLWRVVKATPRLLYARERNRVHILQGDGWAQGRSGRKRKILSSPGFDLRNVQPLGNRYTDYAIQASIWIM
jgi:hypothetical protein